LLVKNVAPHASMMEAVMVNLVLYAAFTLPAFGLAIWTIDKIGHITLQVIGLIGAATGFTAIALIPQVSHSVGMFIAAYGFSSFFMWFGPGITTMLLAAELFTTSIRATAHGFAAGAAKVGAFIGALSFPPMLAAWGLQGAELVAAACCLAAAGLSLIVPEPSRRSLDDVALMRRADRQPSTPDLAAA